MVRLTNIYYDLVSKNISKRNQITAWYIAGGRAGKPWASPCFLWSCTEKLPSWFFYQAHCWFDSWLRIRGLATFDFNIISVFFIGFFSYTISFFCFFFLVASIINTRNVGGIHPQPPVCPWNRCWMSILCAKAFPESLINLRQLEITFDCSMNPWLSSISLAGEIHVRQAYHHVIAIPISSPLSLSALASVSLPSNGAASTFLILSSFLESERKIEGKYGIN